MAQAVGAEATLIKPVAPVELLNAIAQALTAEE